MRAQICAATLSYTDRNFAAQTESSKGKEVNLGSIKFLLPRRKRIGHLNKQTN